MSFFQKISPEWPLRFGLGLMYLYSGYDLFYHPTAWLWAIPRWFSTALPSIISPELYLRMQGTSEIIVGLLFLAWFLGQWGVRVAAVYAIIELSAILIFIGVNLITFRDIGLLGAALAILLMSYKK